jgi:hypothetical protein
VKRLNVRAALIAIPADKKSGRPDTHATATATDVNIG